MKRKILFYGDYFREFYQTQETGVRRKIDFVLDLIRNVEQVPVKFLKHLEGTVGIYEVRIFAGNKHIRIFCFFDEGNVVILTNCFVKKAGKTPKQDLALAKKLKQKYFLMRYN